MIHLSTCPLQVDPFPALSGKLDDQKSYTTPWDTIGHARIDIADRDVSTLGQEQSEALAAWFGDLPLSEHPARTGKVGGSAWISGS